MGNLKKHYIGSIDSQERAARIYDKHAILTHGLRAKTNFSYTKAQIQKIIESASDESVEEGSEEGECPQIILSNNE